MAGILDGLLGGSGSGILGSLSGAGGYLQPRSNMMQMMGLGLLSGNNWQQGFGNMIPAMTAGRALDIAQAEQANKSNALKAYAAENNLTPAQQQMMLANPEIGAKLMAEKMTPKPAQYGVVSEDEYGNKRYGFIDPYSRTATPYGGDQQQAQSASPVAAGGAPQAGQIATAPVAVPPAPPGVDPKLWRQQQTMKLLEQPKIDADVNARQRQAQQLGMQPDDPAYKSYVLTGKLPREDAQPLSATDKKAILEADEQIQTNQAVIQNLQRAKQLSPQANAGWGAGARAAIGNNLPDWMVPDVVSSPDSSLATTDLTNLVTGNALQQLKAVFGGNPTEGERAILLDLQGSASLPDAARQKIYDRAIEMANRRLQFNQQRANELRGGTYYKAGGGNGQAGATANDWQDIGGGVKIRLKAE